MFRDYFVLFSYPEFYGKDNCNDVFDPDVAGRGVRSDIFLGLLLQY